MLIGDSQVETAYCDYDKMPERSLERSLNELLEGRRVKVFSLGASGYGQDQELLSLREYFRKYRADIVAVWETPENDVWNNVFPTHWPAEGTPKPTFWLDDSGRLKGPTEQLGEAVGSSSRVLALFETVLKPHSDRAWERRLPPAYAPISLPAGVTPSRTWQERWDRYQGMRLENLETEKSHLAIRLSPSSARMTYGLKLTNRLLREMKRVSEENRAKFVCFYRDFPGHWTWNTNQSGDEIYALNGKYYRSSNSQFLLNVEAMNKYIECSLIPVTIADWKVSPDDPHLNANAIRQVMHDFSEFLASTVKGRSMTAAAGQRQVASYSAHANRR